MTDATYQWLRLAVYVVGIPIIIVLLLQSARKVRAIRELDARLKAEEEARRAQGIVEDPQMAFARLFAEEEKKKPVSRRGENSRG
ncbi:MAG: hypothetical protein WCP07_01055 [bacterium]